MTDALKKAIHKAKRLPASKQKIVAVVIDNAMKELEEEAREVARLSEPSFAEDWDNEEDAVYDNYKEIYGLS